MRAGSGVPGGSDRLAAANILSGSRTDLTGAVRRAEEACHAFLQAHRVGDLPLDPPLDGGFCLRRGADEEDLYGLVDAVYVLHTLGRLESLTDPGSRRRWANRILACQDDAGWFSRRNLRGHSREHATAYAIGGITLLEVEAGEDHRHHVRPLEGIRPILRSPEHMRRWLGRMGLEGPLDPFRKNLGWQYIWRGSHVAGGVAAALGMMGKRADAWWDEAMPVAAWLEHWFDWLDAEVDPATGLWRRALWNRFVRRPTLIDLGGAAHFHWVYVRAGRPIPHPEAVVASVLSLQKPSGLYRDVPYCIDLDGNFCTLRAWEELDGKARERWREPMERSLLASFDASLAALAGSLDLTDLYRDLHALPGALAALMECVRFPGFPHRSALAGWHHPLERAWWL
jgi:hypothetical protein